MGIDHKPARIHCPTYARLLVRTKAQSKVDVRIRLIFEGGSCDVWIKECGYCEQNPYSCSRNTYGVCVGNAINDILPSVETSREMVCESLPDNLVEDTVVVRDIGINTPGQQILVNDPFTIELL